MTGYLLSPSGFSSELPPLVSWDFALADGSPCDSFCLKFCYDSTWLPILQQAVRFRAVHGGRVVFFGVVDDFEITLEPKGLLCEVSGRSLAALLLDNQVKAAEYVSAQLADMLKNYVTPYGIMSVASDAMRPLSQFVAETGDSCWQVLCGFCRHSADILPRMSPDGTLLLKKAVKKAPKMLSAPLLSCTYRQTRYGVLSKQVVLLAGTSLVQSAENAEFEALGGACTHYCSKSGKKLRATWRDANQKLADSKADFREITAKYAGSFLADVGDCVRLQVSGLGISGSFTVKAAQSHADERGMFCTLTMEG